MSGTILHVIASFEGGGAERQLALLATEQARRGHTVHVAVRRLGVHRALLRDVETHALGDHAGPHPLISARITKLIRTLRPDLVQTWLPQMDVLGGAAALACRVPWVMTERTSWYPRDLASFVRRGFGRLASAIVANSRAGASLWRDAVTIPNIVVVACPVVRAAPHVVFAGRLDEAKQPQVLVDAIARTPLPTMIFGEGPMRGSLERRARGLPITFAGFCVDWHRYLASAIALVAPSRQEGESNTILEALAFERPVIASDTSAHRALVDPSFAVGDPIALARALRAPRFTSHVDLSARTPAAIADRYDALYERVRSRARRT